MRFFPKILMCGLFAFSLSSTAFAQRWITQNNGLRATSRGSDYINIVDSNTVWVTAYDGSGAGKDIRDFCKTTDGGISWMADSIKGPRVRFYHHVANISALNADTAYSVLFDADASNRGAGIFKTTNGGILWNQLDTNMYSRPGRFPNIVHMFSAARGLNMGDPVNSTTVTTPFYEINTTADFGKTWQRVSSDSIPAPTSGEYGIVGVFTAFGDTIVFGTNKGRVFRSVNAGRRWTVSAPYGSGITVAALALRNGREGLIIGSGGTAQSPTDGGIRRTTNGGLTWTNGGIGAATAGINIKRGVSHVPGTNLYVICGVRTGSTGTAYTTDMGTTWTQMDYDQAGGIRPQRTAIAFANARVGWAGQFTTGDPVATGGIVRFNPSTIANSLQVLSTFGTVPRCIGTTVNVPVRIIGRYRTNNSFQLQISDSLGTFTQPVTLASVTTTTMTDTLNTTMSVSLPTTLAGPSFRFRLVSNAPAQTGLLASTFVISRIPTPVVSVGTNDTLFSSTPNAVYQWFLNNSLIAGATSRKLKATATGVYRVRVTSAPCPFVMSSDFQFTPVTSTKKANLLTGVGIYPNPAQNNLSFYTSQSGQSELRISSIAGVELIREQFSADADAHKTVDISALPTGVYFLKATQNGKIATLKFVKQ